MSGDLADFELAPEIEAELYDRLRIDPLALDTEFIQCPSNIAWLGAKHGAALRTYLHAKIGSKKLWALLLIQAREDLQAEQDERQDAEEKAAAAGGRKPTKVKERVTVGEVESRAGTYPMWLDAQAREADAEVAMTIAKTNLTAMLAKRDMLVQMGANVRAEMERDPIIRAHKDHQRRERDIE
jgi:hypothetical protein